MWFASGSFIDEVKTQDKCPLVPSSSAPATGQFMKERLLLSAQCS